MMLLWIHFNGTTMAKSQSPLKVSKTVEVFNVPAKQADFSCVMEFFFGVPSFNTSLAHLNRSRASHITLQLSPPFMANF